MKKLMITAAAALCAAVGFSDGITSANVVGYMGKDLAEKGYYSYTPMFVGIGGEDPAIKDIKATADEDLTGGLLNAYVLNTNRGFAKTYSWCTEDDLMPEDGWYYGSDEEPTTDTLKPGESLQIYAPFAVKFTYAGQVDQGAYDFTIPAKGYYMIGNQHATAMALKDVKATSDSDLTGGLLNAYVLNANRGFAKTFSWCTEDDLMPEDGWYYGSDEEPTTYELEPGEVLQVYAPFALKLSFPSAE